MKNPGQTAHAVWCTAMRFNAWDQWATMSTTERDAWGVVAQNMVLMGKTLSQIEKLAIESAMTRLEGNITATCRELGIGRTTIYRKLRQYGWKRKSGTAWVEPTLEEKHE